MLIRRLLRLSAIDLSRVTRPLYTSRMCWKRRKTAEERKAPRIIEYSPKAKDSPGKLIEIWKNMSVAELAAAMQKHIDHVFEVFLYIEGSENYDQVDSIIDNIKVIQDAVKKCGYKYKIIASPHSEIVAEVKIRDIIRRPPADPTKLIRRPPVVTIMGHVDHGKTTLLDALRHTRVVDQEFGGITQHIGAFSVKLPGSAVTFLDTPGHAAFTAMRARGADATDIVILVVAADDGVMEQTIESIRMAKEANVPIIVAINKIDKPEANVQRTREMLLQQGIQLEEMGGEIQSVPISALKETNLDQLIEAISLQADLMDLKADPGGAVEGLVIESKTDPHRGKLSTALVQRGTLRKGTILVSGIAWAKVRAMFDAAGKPVNEAKPSEAVEILGWRELPMAGEDILEVDSEKFAHEIVKYREHTKSLERSESEKDTIFAKAEEDRKIYRAQLEAKWKMGRFKVRKSGPRQKEIVDKDLGQSFNIVVKGDTGGTLEAILDVLDTYDGDSCKLSLIHYGVGNVSENDIEFAEAFNGYIYTFNVDVPSKVKQLAKSKNVIIKGHNVIYKLVDDIKAEISKLLPAKHVEEIIGEANVLQYFQITEGKKKVCVAGSRCIKGNLKRGSKAKLIRGEQVIYNGTVLALKHLKTDVDTIKKDVECGIKLDDPTIEFKSGDLIQCYIITEQAQKCTWNPGF